jgi:hypothetical protein
VCDDPPLSPDSARLVLRVCLSGGAVLPDAAREDAEGLAMNPTFAAMKKMQDCRHWRWIQVISATYHIDLRMQLQCFDCGRRKYRNW